jgi:nucleoside-diphosphate-sugar epimerase
MRIMVAGATGVIGRRLVPWLVESGHEVTGLTRSERRVGGIIAAGGQAMVADVFDDTRLAHALVAARPEVVVHQLTDLASPPGHGIGPEELARTARLRDEGTEKLVKAAQLAGARRIIAQSVAFLYAHGPEPYGEDDPLVEPDPDGPPTVEGIRALEHRVLGAERLDGVVLRYGFLYGPGTGYPAAALAPSVHVDAAAWAAVCAVERGMPGIYNVTDDPGPVDNRRARQELGWDPNARRPDPNGREPGAETQPALLMGGSKS